MKTVQSLTGSIAALSRFISRSSEKCHKFFPLLKKKKDFDWTLDCQHALRDLKKYLSSPLLLHKLKADGKLFLYLAISDVVVSVVECEVRQVTEEQNSEADALANLGSSVDIEGISSGKVVQPLNSSIDNSHGEVNSTSFTWDWRNKYINYLKDGKLPTDPKESRALRTKVAKYCIADGQLYWRSFYGPLPRCLGPGETDDVMCEVHEGHCGNHSGAELLVRKIIRAGYFWSTMEKDAKSLVQKCDECQRHAHMIHQLAELLHPIVSPWPFMKWGMDIVGPLPVVPRQVKFILIMTDCFSKWIEAGTLKKIREREVIDFIWDHIICRFVIPKEITCDNGPQFASRKITEFFDGKRRESLPEVLCAYKTTTKINTGETSFSLVYGTEALSLVEVGEPSLRFSHANDESNNEAMAVKLDLMEEHHEMAFLQVVAQKQRMEKCYNRRTNLRHFQVGNLVLRKVTCNIKNPNEGKLGPN
ncbi:uncharacterized protein LOC132038106 [Lycium ferocissimum]|uniref:uncharacterized protein LOC132038106 n=1 Tax=Lycium ferocissimum TaxID=112874 RepID=UPI002815AEC0|nr:uncharacterized protein LOC132038106 [Lycium ferocissimum]